MVDESDGVRALRVAASSVLLEHDYSANFYHRNDDRGTTPAGNRRNAFGTGNKFRGTFDAVDKWAVCVVSRSPIGHDRRRIVDREITIHKVKYPFLPEQQIRGKVYKKFGIPTVMGGVSSRDVASFSGSIRKDPSNSRRSYSARSNEGRVIAASSRDPGGWPECEQNSQDVSSRSEPSEEIYQSFTTQESRGKSEEQEFLRVLELNEKSGVSPSSESSQLVSPLDLDQLSSDVTYVGERNARRSVPSQSIYSQPTQICRANERVEIRCERTPSRLDSSEFSLLERIRKVGDAVRGRKRKYDEASSEHSDVVDGLEVVRESGKKRTISFLMEPSVSAKQGHTEVKYVETLGTVHYKRAKMIDDRSSSLHERPEVNDIRSSARNAVDLDHSYNGERRIDLSVTPKSRSTTSFSRHVLGRATPEKPRNEKKSPATAEDSANKENREGNSRRVASNSRHEANHEITVKPEVAKEPRKNREVIDHRNFWENLNVSPIKFVPRGPRASPPRDLLANRCREYDRALAIDHCDRAKSIGERYRSRVPMSKIAARVERIIQFLDEDCADF